MTGRIGRSSRRFAWLTTAALLACHDGGIAPKAQDQGSNVRAADYVGPKACAECHAERYLQWQAHPHRRMNQNASEAAVVGRFDGSFVDYGGTRTTFERRGGDFVMSHALILPGEAPVLLRRDKITRTVGSRFQQAYVGVQIEGPEPQGHPLYQDERALPYVYWLSRGLWVPEHYVEPYPQPEYDADGELNYPIDDPYARGMRTWQDGCLLCHNTYPFEFRVGAPYPGTGFAGVAWREPEPAREPGPASLVTMGVSCEACHFGGRDHVEREREMRSRPVSPDLGWLAEPASRGASNAICAQCHVAKALTYPDGAACQNSSEARDASLGACNPEIRCTDCHDPHVAGPVDHAAPERDRSSTCTNCHAAFSGAAARAHSHHGAEVTCLDCHMPRVNQGIDAVVRTHKIGSPTETAMLGAAAPNACNLCHLDRSMRWTLDHLAQDFGRSIAPTAAWSAHYGEELERPVGEVWVGHPDPAVRLVATDAYARVRPRHEALPRLLDAMLDAYPHNRMFALGALERMLGRRLSMGEYTPTASPEERKRQVEDLRSLPSMVGRSTL